jgi:hypothetical protein
VQQRLFVRMLAVMLPAAMAPKSVSPAGAPGAAGWAMPAQSQAFLKDEGSTLSAVQGAWDIDFGKWKAYVPDLERDFRAAADRRFIRPVIFC